MSPPLPSPPLHVRVARRVFDVLLAVAGLVLLAPAAVAIAAAILCESPGPVLERTICVGRDRRHRLVPGPGARRLHDAGGQLFALRSFRTTGAARTAAARTAAGVPSPLTRTGRVLVATGLERLPGLLAVLAGHLSLVGPRPLPARWIARLDERVPELRDALRGSRPGLIGPGPWSLPPDASLDEALVAVLARRVLVDLPWATRRRRERHAFEAWGDDLLALCIAPVASRAPRRGHDVVRIEQPARFHQIPLDADELAAAAQTGHDAASDHRDGGTVTWWYPRRRAANARDPDPMRRRFAGDGACAITEGWCDGLHRFDPWEVVVVKELQPAPGPDDGLSCELPADLNGLESVCRHLMPVWHALAWRAVESDLAAHATVALLEMSAWIAARSRSSDDRIDLSVSVGSRGMRLCARLQPAGASAPTAIPGLVLGRWTGGLGHRGEAVTPR